MPDALLTPNQQCQSTEGTQVVSITASKNPQVLKQGVSRPPVLDCRTTFHLDYGSRDLTSTPSENLFISRPKRLVTLLNV